MKRADSLLNRCLALALCLALMISAAYAVTKTLTLVDGSGKPVPKGTQVTIIYPDGVTRDTDETDDDKGTFYYNFPDDGDYQLVYAGGTLTVNVAAGGGGLTAGQWVGAGLATATVIGVAVVAGDSGTKSSGSSSDSGSSGGSGTTADEACQGSDFNFIGGLSTSVVSNPGSHPNDFDGDWEIFCDAGGAPPRVLYVGSNMLNVEWTCAAGGSNDCVATTDCTYEGFSTICELDSDFTSSDWSGTMTAGSDGNLPPGGGSGQPIVVSFGTSL